VHYEAHGRLRKGVCSTFLAERAALERPVPVFVHTGPGFRLPADPDPPIIMIGAGARLAPFRAVLEDREADGACGPNGPRAGNQTTPGSGPRVTKS